MSIRIEDQYANSNPADANYPEGSFKNSSTPTALDGTPLEKAWCNDLQGLLQKMLDVWNITPSGIPDTILAGDYFNALSNFLSSPGFGVDTGSASAYAIAVNETFTAYSDGQLFAFKATNNSNAGATANVNTRGAKAIVMPDGSAIRANDILVGDFVQLRYDSVADNLIYVNYQKRIVISQKQYKNLLIVAGTDPTTDIDITADELYLTGPGGLQHMALNLSLLDVDTLDTGSFAASTEYYIWVFFNPSAGTYAGRYSLSSTAPTPPDANHTFKVVLGAIFTDISSDLKPIRQKDNVMIYITAPTVLDGGMAQNVWTSVSLSGIAPLIAKIDNFWMSSIANPAQFGIAPLSNGQGGDISGMASNGANSTWGGILPTAREVAGGLEIMHEDAVYYWTTQATTSLVYKGCKY